MGILFQRRHLGDCLLLIKNGANIKQDKGTGGIPITRIETLSGGVFNRDRLGYAGIDQPGKYESFILESGDLLFSHINSKAYIGRTVLYQKEGSEVIIHGMNLLRIKVIPELLIPKYLYYTTLTEGFKSQVASSRKDAVNQSSISVSDIKRIIIPVPSLIEQQRIVDELDLLTGIIEKKNAQLRDLDTLAQSIFYEMFGNIIANEKKWPFGRFADICAPRSSIKRASKSYLPSDSIEYIDISSIDNKRQKLTGTTAFIFSDAPSRAQQVVQYEDVLISMVRPNLKNIAVVDLDHNRLVASSGFCVLRANNRSNSSFIKSFIGTDAFTQHLMDRVTGANYPAVKEDDIKGCRIGVPPVDLQRQFAERVAVIERQKQLISSAIDEVGRLLSGRMDLYFNE
ncbi:MAG: restriction endonuclease subunit S [Bacteroidales bacterium]|nr:restriction endonuclease subunit S [Bacteroidales bacterium]